MMQTMPGVFASGFLASGTAVIIPMRGMPLPATVWVAPASGDTVTVSYSVDNGVSYVAWSLGPVTSASTEKALAFYSGVTHLQIQRTAGSGTTSAYGVN